MKPTIVDRLAAAFRRGEDEYKAEQEAEQEAKRLARLLQDAFADPETTRRLTAALEAETARRRSR